MQTIREIMKSLVTMLLHNGKNMILAGVYLRDLTEKLKKGVRR